MMRSAEGWWSSPPSSASRDRKDAFDEDALAFEPTDGDGTRYDTKLLGLDIEATEAIIRT